MPPGSNAVVPVEETLLVSEEDEVGICIEVTVLLRAFCDALTIAIDVLVTKCRLKKFLKIKTLGF